MTWAYEFSFSESRDQVRREIGDVDSTDQQLQDEEIAQAVALEGDVVAAAARCAEWLQARYARKVTSAVGDLQISYSDLAKQYRDLAKTLRAKVGTYASPYAGGISISRKDTVESDTDRVQPAFGVGMLTHPDNTTGTTDE